MTPMMNPIVIPSRVRVRVRVEWFTIHEDERAYNVESRKEVVLETCADPTEDNLKMMQQQVTLCLEGYRPMEILS